MRVLVTGGAGFLGSAFVRRVVGLRPDVEVVVLDAFTYAGSRAALAPVADRVEIVVGDVAVPADVDPLVRWSDAVVHFAAESHNDASLADPSPFVRTNTLGTFVVLEAVRLHDRRLHHVSTDEVFGALDEGADAFVPSSPYRPSSPYSATKAASDLLVRAWVRSYGLRATITTATNCYGPFQDVEKLIPRQIALILDGNRPRLYGDGLHEREWLHCEDHADAVLAALERGVPGRTYLVGSGQRWSNRRVAEELLGLMGRSPDEVELVADRAGHDRRYALDSSATRADLGWAPARADLHAGLRETIEWYREHESWWRPRQAESERRYRSTGQ